MSSPRSSPLPELGPGAAVVVLGLVSALSWGAGDFGGGLLSRRAPLLGVVGMTQLVGMVAALALAILLAEPFPSGSDIAWAVTGGVFGVVGITSLYRGLSVGRMGVVAPVTGVLSAAVPVTFGFLTEGIPPATVVVGIVVALVAVVLVTRTPEAAAGKPSGVQWALIAGLANGAFNICVGQFSGESAFGLLVIVRLVQALILGGVILLGRQAWRLPRDVVPKLVLVGLLDMGGNAAFILAAAAGDLAIAAVLSSLYPVVTVLLAITLLREHVTRSHILGIGLTGVAIALIAGGAAAA
jgi:drug/metabolite transporter (DMT)-like permease